MDDRMEEENGKKTVHDSVALLHQYSHAMRGMYHALTRISSDLRDPTIVNLLGDIEKLNEQCANFLYEEACSTIVHRDTRQENILFETWPNDLSLVASEQGFLVRNIPVWMLGHGASQRFHPLFHKNQTVFYKRQVWRAVIGKLRADYEHSLARKDKNPLENPLPWNGIMVVQFRSSVTTGRIRDLDHYLPMLSIMVNAMRDNGLLCSDTPQHFCYAVEWKEDSKAEPPRLDVYLRWSETPPSKNFVERVWPESQWMEKTVNMTPVANEPKILRQVDIREEWETMKRKLGMSDRSDKS